MTNRVLAALLAAQLIGYAQAASANEGRASAVDVASYQWEAMYTGDLWRNTRGGLRTGAAYLDNLDLTLSVDGERTWGIPGFEAFVSVLYNNAAGFSSRYVGDSMIVSNIDAGRALRLYEAWLQWTGGAGGELSVRFGLYDMNSEFDASDTRALFIHSTHGVGHELAQTGKNGPSIFPVTSLAVRVAWRIAQNWRLLTAVFDGVPGDREDPNRSGIYLSSDEGVLAMTEVQWSSGRIKKLSLGHWRYTADFDDVRSTKTEPLPRRDDNTGVYGEFEVALSSNFDDAATTAFVRYGVANGRINEYEDYLGAGVRRRGFGARVDDELGLAFSLTHVSADVRALAASEGRARQRYESAIELTYRAPINNWLTLQPDVQYIFNPGADQALSDSLTIGLRFELTWMAYR